MPIRTRPSSLLLLLLLAMLLDTCRSSCLRQLSSCACETAEGVIDLSPLSLPSTYPFSSSAPGSADVFQWSPCIGQLCGNQLNTAVCETFGLNTIPVGQSDTAKFVSHPARGLQLVYTDSRVGSVDYTSYIVLICDPTAEEPAFSAEGGVFNLFMHMRSKYACPGGSGSSGSGLSTGDNICIIFAVSFVIYLCCGLLFNKFIQGKEGSELIPNKLFWISLPGYIRDGCLFSAERIGCKRTGSRTAYEAVE